MRYYRIYSDMEDSEGWSLEGPMDIDGESVGPFNFIGCQQFRAQTRLRCNVNDPGIPRGLTFAAFDVPIASLEIGQAFQAIAPSAIQVIPVDIFQEGRRMGGYAVLNVIETVHCLDEAHSGIAWWTEEDGRPEKIGKYQTVTHMAIDSRRAAGHRLFRLGGWQVALISMKLGKHSWSPLVLPESSFSNLLCIELALRSFASGG